MYRWTHGISTGRLVGGEREIDTYQAQHEAVYGSETLLSVDTYSLL